MNCAVRKLTLFRSLKTNMISSLKHFRLPKVREVRFHEVEGVAEVVVPDHQLSLAIGREGQNARLAARLTGWRIDIKSETQILDEETAYAEGDWAEGEWVTDPETGEQTWVPADGSEAMSADDWATAAEEAEADQAVGEQPTKTVQKLPARNRVTEMLSPVKKLTMRDLQKK